MKIKIKRKIYEAVLQEIAREEIQKLIGKEAAIKYRKASTGEVKTYFGRFVKINGENVYAGLLGKGLRSLKIANILQVSPANFEAEQLKELDEMCGKKYEGGPGSGVKGHTTPQQHLSNLANKMEKEGDKVGHKDVLKFSELLKNKDYKNALKVAANMDTATKERIPSSVFKDLKGKISPKDWDKIASGVYGIERESITEERVKPQKS